MDEESQETSQGQQQANQSVYTGKHRAAAISHVLFKVFPIVIFFLPFWDDDTMRFIVLVILGALDFWVTKNVTGRVLVALRWWNSVKENGETEWIFEAGDRALVSSCDSLVFWGMCIGSLTFWIAYTVIEIISFNWTWLPASILQSVLMMANLYGYAKCKKDWKKTGAQFAMQQAQENPELAMKAMTTVATSGAAGAATSSSSQQQQPQQQDDFDSYDGKLGR